MSRFFKKSENINSLQDKDVDKFLQKEKLNGKIAPDRVKDFYNALSTIMFDGQIRDEEQTNYDHFGCKNSTDRKKIDIVKSKEKDFLRNIDPALLSGGRILKAATVLSHRFEKMICEDACEQPNDNNEYLKNLFRYEEEQEIIGQPIDFSKLIEEDAAFLKYIALLSSKSAFAKANVKVELCPEGKIVKYKPMDGMQDVVNGDLVQFVMPDFNKKLATEDMYVRKRFDKVKKAQNLIILVDDSGSMNTRDKKAMLKAAISLKLRDWKDNNIYIGTFISEVFGFVKVEELTKFENLKFITLSGGNTDVGDCVKEVIKNIKLKKLPKFKDGGWHELSEHHFEILVVNDGQDHVDAEWHPDIKLHACCLVESNNALKDVCLRSGGTYNYIKGKEE